MYLENHEVKNIILLTGAGFTKNFGGFLANEMWALIFNYPEIKKYPKLIKLLKNDFDYESAYYKVIEGNEFGEGKEVFTDAVFSAYKKLDDKIKYYYSLGTKQPVNISDVCKFMDRFSGFPVNPGKDNVKGFFFTLNQDLFVERYYHTNYNPVTLSVHQPKVNQNEEFDERKHSLVLPLSSDVEKNNSLYSSKYFYVKLHGSWNWYSSDGTKKLVIGKNKLKQIYDEPILKEYFELFEKVLSSQRVRLFVMGYGFGDEHINKIIADSINNNKLKLYIMNPSSPESFKHDLVRNDKPHGKVIWDGLTGYYPFNLSQVFPGGETIEYKLIWDSYFDSL